MNNDVALAVKSLLLLANRDASSEKDIGILMEALDHLAYLSHNLTFEVDEAEYGDPPTCDPVINYKNATAWLGVSALSSDQEELDRSGAIMDFAELLDDFDEISWRFKNTSVSDALFCFEHGFRSHWGHHMRSLQKYLHHWYW